MDLLGGIFLTAHRSSPRDEMEIGLGSSFCSSHDQLGNLYLMLIATTLPRGLVYGVHFVILAIFGPPQIMIMGFHDYGIPWWWDSVIMGFRDDGIPKSFRARAVRARAGGVTWPSPCERHYFSVWPLCSAIWTTEKIGKYNKTKEIIRTYEKATMLL